MKRTKPTKKQINILNSLPHGQFGGCMPNPPDECTKPREFIGADGTEYINNALCIDCPNICTRKKEFSNEWKEYWRAYKQIRRDMGFLNETGNGQDLVV